MTDETGTTTAATNPRSDEPPQGKTESKQSPAARTRLDLDLAIYDFDVLVPRVAKAFGRLSKVERPVAAER